MAKHYVEVEGHWDEARLSSGFPRRHWRSAWRPWAVWGSGSNRCWERASDPYGPTALRRTWHSPRGRGAALDDGPHFFGSGRGNRVGSRPPSSNEPRCSMPYCPICTASSACLTSVISPRRSFANPRFLRPCHGVMPRGGVSLLSYPADLARFPDGTWRVISDRRRPFGIGLCAGESAGSARALSDVSASIGCARWELFSTPSATLCCG